MPRTRTRNPDDDATAADTDLTVEPIADEPETPVEAIGAAAADTKRRLPDIGPGLRAADTFLRAKHDQSRLGVSAVQKRLAPMRAELVRGKERFENDLHLVNKVRAIAQRVNQLMRSRDRLGLEVRNRLRWLQNWIAALPSMSTTPQYIANRIAELDGLQEITLRQFPAWEKSWVQTAREALSGSPVTLYEQIVEEWAALTPELQRLAPNEPPLEYAVRVDKTEPRPLRAKTDLTEW